MGKVNIVISYKNKDNISVQVKNKLIEKFNNIERPPRAIDWNYGITEATDLRSAIFTSKLIYHIMQSEGEELEQEAKSLSDWLGEEVKSFDMDIQVEGYELA